MSNYTGAKKDFISTQEWDKKDLDAILDLASEIKSNREQYYDALKGKSLCMFFFNPSTRTRNSFEVGMWELGGHAVYNDLKSSWLGYNSESVKDTASVLGRYYNAIGIRIFPNVVGWQYKMAHYKIREFQKYARSSVINFEDDMFHPTQAISDIFTLKEKFKGDFKHKKFVLSWAYHPKPLPMSVPNSILLITTRYGLDVTLACPPGYELSDEIIEMARENAKNANSEFIIEHDIEKAYEGADVIYVKSWGSFKTYGRPKEEKKLRIPYRNKWICNQDLMDLTKPSSYFMHCLPVRRNVVVTDEVIDGPHSIVYDQAENRLHGQKAILYTLLKNNDKI
ncbi:MAG: N-acetylornithine carbamoyltransferase [Promethearchaeota archaeon]